jgi:hypothetical protein
MKIAVLLGQLRAKGDLNGHMAGRQFDESGAEVLHDSLTRETAADTGFIVGIGSCKSRMVSHEGEYISGRATQQEARLVEDVPRLGALRERLIEG